MASAKLSIRIAAEDAASPILKSIGGALSGITGAVTAPVRALGGLTDVLGRVGLAGMGLKAIGEGIAGAVQGLVGDAVEAQKIAAATDAVVASTKGVAGMSSQAVGDLASSLSTVIPVEDDVIQGAENMLLTFTNIRKDVFPGATEAALDMSVALGQDAKQSAMMLGKALNDPIAGVTALRRVGVQLTDQQEAMVKKFMAVGDVASAQKVILGELATEFGGAARAAGQTFAGKLAILNTQVGNVKEAVGNALLPVLSRLVDRATPLVVAFGEKVPAAFDAASGAVSAILGYLDPGNQRDLMREWFGDAGPYIDNAVRAAKAFVGTVGELGAAFGGLISGGGLGQFMADIQKATGLDISSVVEPMVEVFLGLKDVVGGALSGDWGKALGGLRAVGTVVLSVLGDLLKQVWGWIQAQAPVWLAQLAVWGNALWQWIAPMIPPLLAQLGVLAGQLWTWVQGQAPVLLDKLKSWGNSLWAWIEPQIPLLIAKAETLANNLWVWIGKQVAPLLDKLGAWASALVAWIVPAAADFLQHWPAMFNQFLDWIGAQVPPLLAKLGEWAKSFVSWIGPRIPDILLALGGIILAIDIWIAETAITLGLKLLQWAWEFVKWIAPMIPQIPGELDKLGRAIGTWIVETAAPFIGGQVKKWAPVFWDWIKTDLLPNLGTELSKIIAAIGNWVTTEGVPALKREAAKLGAALLPSISLPSIPGLQIPGVQVPGFASGVENFAGGLAVVGERGPELVNLPRGSNVIPMSGRGGVSIVVNQTFNGPADAGQVRRASGDGVLSAARQLGLAVS